ncbi:hypothetical protein [Cytophaga hutchinsonii]|nr:hypothetical protein [Cytophaga hutchinsonii]SFX75366.1 hypothetical protein SAMN04487930_10948 [Cytophaga hutchinsonii ATCC 33406]
MRSLFFSCILLLSITVKGYSQSIAADTTNKNYIEFGNGGGFTGAVKSHILTQEGNLFQLENQSGATFVKKIKHCKVKHIYRYVIKNNMAACVYNEPGNTYAFITIQLNKQTNKIIWNNSNILTPPTITKLYNKLIKLR